MQVIGVCIRCVVILEPVKTAKTDLSMNCM